jgi:heme-degrading monooxygenase HmoA
MNQTGYISGETLKNMVKPETFLVISTWETAADWERWFLSKERQELQSKIDTLLEEETEYDIFYFGLDDKEII